jgi:hypothetical protein
MADSNTEESSPVAKDDNINAIPETSSSEEWRNHQILTTQFTILMRDGAATF